jgi:hypothetical protein
MHYLWLVNVIIDGTKQHVSYKRRGHVILVAHTLKNVVSHGQSSCDPTTPTLRRPAQAIQHPVAAPEIFIWWCYGGALRFTEGAMKLG